MTDQPIKLDPIQVLIGLHKVIDEQIAKVLAKSEEPISCKRGCNYCCYMMTAIGPAEGYLIAAEVVTWPNWDSIARRLRKSAKKCSTKLSRGEYFNKQIPCVFLNKDGDCSIYLRRPAACRCYFVASPRDDCRPSEEENHVKALNLTELEALVWRFETDASPNGQVPVNAPLPLMVLYSMAGLSTTADRQRFFKKLLKDVQSPSQWVQGVVDNIDHVIGGETTEAREAVLDSMKKFGLMPNKEEQNGS